ncbi:hypothetical protein OY671_008878, partial [Metschnikowia pulcherrima]
DFHDGEPHLAHSAQINALTGAISVTMSRASIASPAPWTRAASPGSTTRASMAYSLNPRCRAKPARVRYWAGESRTVWASALMMPLPARCYSPSRKTAQLRRSRVLPHGPILLDKRRPSTSLALTLGRSTARR